MHSDSDLAKAIRQLRVPGVGDAVLGAVLEWLTTAPGKGCSKPKKPTKPYPEFPLYAAGNGQWAKTIGGKRWHFGPWRDPEAALERYKAEALGAKKAAPEPSVIAQDGLISEPVSISGSPQHYSVSDLAKIMGRSRSSINTLIARGLLRAYDAAPEAKLRQWRVTPEALQEFVERNSIQQQQGRRKRKRPSRDYQEIL